MIWSRSCHHEGRGCLALAVLTNNKRIKLWWKGGNPLSPSHCWHLSWKLCWVEGISPSELITQNYFKVLCLCKQLLIGSFCSSTYIKKVFSLDITHFVSCCWQNILVLPPTLRSCHIIEYTSPKSRVTFSFYFPQFLPHVVLVSLEVENVPFLWGLAFIRNEYLGYGLKYCKDWILDMCVLPGAGKQI